MDPRDRPRRGRDRADPRGRGVVQRLRSSARPVAPDSWGPTARGTAFGGAQDGLVNGAWRDTMRLTWKDGVTTLFAVAVVLVTMSVVQGWDWPLLGSYRAGTVALVVLGMGMCATGGSTIQSLSMRNPYVATTSILAGLA